MANASLKDVAEFENTLDINYLFDPLIENNEKILALLEVGLDCDFSRKPTEVAYHYFSVVHDISLKIRENIDSILVYQGDEYEKE
jgi:hypothetical protein